MEKIYIKSARKVSRFTNKWHIKVRQQSAYYHYLEEKSEKANQERIKLELDYWLGPYLKNLSRIEFPNFTSCMAAKRKRNLGNRKMMLQNFFFDFCRAKVAMLHGTWTGYKGRNPNLTVGNPLSKRNPPSKKLHLQPLSGEPTVLYFSILLM